MLVYDSTCTIWCTIIHIRNHNTILRRTSMHYLASANAKSNVSNTASILVEDKVTGLCLAYTNCSTIARLRT